MSQRQAFPNGGSLAGVRDDRRVLEVLSEPMVLTVLERRLAQAGHRIDPLRLRTLLGEMQAGQLIQTSGLAAEAIYSRTVRGQALCAPRATSPPLEDAGD